MLQTNACRNSINRRVLFSSANLRRSNRPAASHVKPEDNFPEVSSVDRKATAEPFIVKSRTSIRRACFDTASGFSNVTRIPKRRPGCSALRTVRQLATQLEDGLVARRVHSPPFSKRGGCAINKKIPFLSGADGVVNKFQQK